MEKTVYFWQPLWQPHAWLKSDIASPHGDEQKENERRKEGEGGILVSWFAGGASITWEWIGVMTLFLSTSWVHLYIHLSLRRKGYSPVRATADKRDKQADRQNPPPVESPLSCWHFDVHYTSQVSWLFSEEIRDWFWIIQGSGFHCKMPGRGWCRIQEKQYWSYMKKDQQDGYGLRNETLLWCSSDDWTSKYAALSSDWKGELPVNRRCPEGFFKD